MTHAMCRYLSVRTVNLFAALQVLFLIIYLFLNITNAGKGGTAIALLLIFFILSVVVIFVQSYNNNLVLRVYFLIFILFVLWMMLRVAIDLDSLEYLKSITVATTGGVALFFFIGTFVRKALDSLTLSSGGLLVRKLLLLILFSGSCFIFYHFNSRLLREDIFLIHGVDGDYQRPGNFIAITFIVVSFLYITTISHWHTRKIRSLFFWMLIYSLIFLLLLINSQLIGSNGATANLLAIYMITIVMSFVAFDRTIRRYFIANKLNLPSSKYIFKSISAYSMMWLIIALLLLVLTLYIGGIDLNRTNIFGYGSGEVRSITSRVQIFFESGLQQMAYSPFFGNVNVAYLTTGDEGRTLHNFIPNIIAELGFIGLLIVCVLFFFIYRGLYLNTKMMAKDNLDYQNTMTGIWLLFILTFLLFYANLAVGKSWSVLWFYTGFVLSAFYFKANKLRESTGSVNNEQCFVRLSANSE